MTKRKNIQKSPGNVTNNVEDDQNNNLGTNQPNSNRSPNQTQSTSSRSQIRRSDNTNLNRKLVFFKEIEPICRKYKVITTAEPYAEIAKQNRRGYAYLFSI